MKVYKFFFLPFQPQVGVNLEWEKHKTVKNQKVKTYNWRDKHYITKKWGPREEKIPNDMKQKL